MLQDIRLALRSMRRRPGFFAVLIATLAIGIGANTAIFSIVDTVLLEPLPYPDAHEMLALGDSPWIPMEPLIEVRESSRALREIAGFYPRRFAVRGAEQPLELEGAEASFNFFAFLGAGTAIGRTFSEADAKPGAPPVAILGQGLSQRLYGGAGGALGETIRVNGTPRQIIGVLEPGFRFYAPRSKAPQLWVPLSFQPSRPDGSLNWAIPMARLRRGAAMSAAQAELDAALSRFTRRHPEEEGRHLDLRWEPLLARLTRDVRPALLVLQAAVGMILLIACVNVANLLLARSRTRLRQLAVRSALGASRLRLIRQLMTESLVFSVAGGLAGFLITAWGLSWLVSAAPPDIPRVSQVSLDFSVFAFALGATVATGLLFGLFPALRLGRRRLAGSLRSEGRTAAGPGGKHRASRALVVAEVTLTLILLVSAGLLMRTFLELSDRQWGFATEDVLAARLQVPGDRYQDVSGLNAFYSRLLERVGQVPGIEAAALSNNLPSDRSHSIREFVAEGTTQTRRADYAVVTPGYFQALGINLLRGRAFRGADHTEAPGVVVIDQAMWRLLWPDQDPIGRRFRMGGADESGQPWLTVVGVVANPLAEGTDSAPRPGFYIPHQQRPRTRVELATGRRAFLIARSSLPPSQAADPLREAIWDVDPLQPVPEVASLSGILSKGIHPQRFRACLLGAFAALALLLALAGVYGVVEYLVADRTHEFGVRMALGATRADILQAVLGWGFRLTAAGAVLGLLGSLAAVRLLSNLLYGVAPTDPLTLAASLVAVLLVGLAACLVPARKATRIDPLAALRSEGTGRV